MNVISLSVFDLSLAAVLVLLLAILSFTFKLAFHRPLLIATLRMLIQLSLIGLVLKALFSYASPVWMILVSSVMLLAASREVWARQQRPVKGWAGFIASFSGLSVAGFCVTLLTLLVIIGNDPWYSPQYAIPLLGMILGNAMTGISLALDHLTNQSYKQRALIEQRLALGQTWKQSIQSISHEAIRAGILPTLNMLTAAGIVSLPGMMTGQILAGVAPAEAVKYQILIMLLISTTTGVGMLIAIHLTSHQLFDQRHRLRLDRLHSSKTH